jgi:hypothetical protein
MARRGGGDARHRDPAMSSALIFAPAWAETRPSTAFRHTSAMDFLAALLVRAVASAAIVVIASVAAEAAGPFWGGLIISLPIAAGPAYVMLALQHDAAFIAASALGSVTTNAATFVLLTTIALLAPRHPRWRTIGSALGAWACAVAAIHTIDWSLGGAILLNLGVIALAYPLTRRAAHAPGGVPTGAPTGASTGARAPLRRRWFELPYRAALVGLVVAVVVTASHALGPSVTGMASVFPVAFTSFAFLMLPRLGGVGAAAVMASAVRALPGFALSLLVLHLTAIPLGTWPALLAMLVTSLVWSAGMMAVRPRRPGPGLAVSGVAPRTAAPPPRLTT